MKNIVGWGPAAYLENREGGQSLGGRHFTQERRRAVVIGGAFRRDFSSLEGAFQLDFSCKHVRDWRVPGA